MSINAFLASLGRSHIPALHVKHPRRGFYRNWVLRDSQKTSIELSWVFKVRLTFTDFILKHNFWEDGATTTLILYIKWTKFSSLEALAEYLSVDERLSCETGFKSGSFGFRQGRDLNFTELQWEYNHMIKGMRKIQPSLQKLTSTKWGLIRNTEGLICTGFVETWFLWLWASAVIEEPGDRTDRSNTQAEVPVLENSEIRQELSFFNVKSWL